MARQLWVLLGWSPEYGAPTTPVAVLGVDVHGDGTVQRVVEWVPREYHHAQTWRERLATTPVDDLSAQMAWWENSPAAPAARIEPAPSTVDLATAVQVQLDSLLA